MSNDAITNANPGDPRPATIFGIDSHARTTTICALVVATGEAVTRTFRGNDYADMSGWMAGFPAPARGVYEAGCTGFVPARLLSGGSVAVVPIAPSKMPTSSESRARKNDRNDAARLARLALAGELREVWVPSEEVEGLRDLTNALDDLKDQRERAYRRVEALLCRHGVVWDRRTRSDRLKKSWGEEWWSWLRGIELADPVSQAALLAATRAAESAREQYDELLRRAHELAAVVTAATFVSEVPDVGAFASAAKLAAYAGLAPRVRQSGRSLNSVTRPRAGNRRLKRALVLSAARSVDFCEESRAYYDRKRSEGRCHYSAAVALARRRINVMYAMLRDGKRYESRPG